MGKLLSNKNHHRYRRVLRVKTCCWRVCSTFYSQNIKTIKPIYTQTCIFNIHDPQASQTPHQIYHTACKQVSLWSITLNLYFRCGK